MTELHDLLTRAADGPDRTGVTPADVDADVARGIRALRRRRTGAAGGILVAAVAAAAIPVALNAPAGAGGAGVAPGGGTASSQQSLDAEQAKKAKAAADPTSEAEATAVKKAAQTRDLAAAQRPWLAGGAAVPVTTYKGPELPGSFQPGLMPVGTVVQGGSAYRLTIARAADTDTNPDSFTGKIVVMLSGREAPDAATVEEPDPFGTVVVVPLAHPIDGAQAFEVQFPSGTGWTDDEAVKFASSIDVLPTALSGKG